MEKPKSPFNFRKDENKTESNPQSGEDVTNWHEQSISRRTANKKIAKGVAWAAGLGIVGLGGYKLFSSDETDVERDSHELQEKEGWNVGSVDKQLAFDPTLTSATASVADSEWKQYLAPAKLISAYQPNDSKWQPYFVPTLIQSLSQETLKSQMKAVKTPLMEQTYAQGQALRELLSQSANANESLIVSELEGTASVALGAALADFATIVPTFDNWPHPLGVARSHETLGAMMYYAQEIENKKAKLKPDAPALLLLDSQRLNEYKDEENQFDNRYMAKIPSAADLKQRGIKSLLYVVKDESRKEEMDDLNDVFVDYQNQGIPVRFLKLSDFKMPDSTQLATTAGTTGQANTVVERRYYYGGSPMMHWWFYSHYYYNPYPGAYTSYGGSRYAYSRPSTPAAFSPPAYRAVSRPTVFAGTRVGGASGVGRARPSGFGRTSVRMSSGGQVTGVRSGRSGSFGRSGGGFFGG